MSPFKQRNSAYLIAGLLGLVIGVLLIVTGGYSINVVGAGVGLTICIALLVIFDNTGVSVLLDNPISRIAVIFVLAVAGSILATEAPNIAITAIIGASVGLFVYGFLINPNSSLVEQ